MGICEWWYVIRLWSARHHVVPSSSRYRIFGLGSPCLFEYRSPGQCSNWFRSQQKDFYEQDIHCIMVQWDKYLCNFWITVEINYLISLCGSCIFIWCKLIYINNSGGKKNFRWTTLNAFKRSSWLLAPLFTALFERRLLCMCVL